ncbi:Uncharacterized protein GBIM_08152 [Gryllus bimaculatus]|nr:Uncharacterized protein GBIM_08152 [Gryllus bimaculatus]
MGRTLHAIGPESSGTKVHRKNGARVRLLTPDSSQNGGDLSDGSFTDVEGEGDEDDEASGLSDGESGIVKVPLRNARRKSVMPKSAPVIKVNDIEYLDVPDHSPGNSITSINSIASLLKEKLALTLPAVVKKPPKRSNEYKLHAFVGLLFLCIVFLVGFAYVFYHQQVLQVNPIVKEYLKAYGPLDEGLPFNRPLWMLDPKDPICHTIVDEFSVGEELIVAPVITKDAREREIYLPAGVWRDGIDGSLMKGSRWLHHHPVEEDKIAYFVRMPDDTRF